jgi:Protein of unknown function (DUF3617)
MRAIALGIAMTLIAVAAAQEKPDHPQGAASQDQHLRPPLAATQDGFVRPQVKTGLWEQTITMTRQGILGMPEDVLSRLTPEQRARAEARLKTAEQPYTHSITSQSCLTEKDLEDWRLFKSSDISCKQKVINSTGTELDAQWDCQIEGGYTGKGTVHIDILSPESARGTAHTEAEGEGHRMVVESKMTSKWIGSDCSKIRNQ